LENTVNGSTDEADHDIACEFAKLVPYERDGRRTEYWIWIISEEQGTRVAYYGSDLDVALVEWDSVLEKGFLPTVSVYSISISGQSDAIMFDPIMRLA
jgi:hypothetical protein